MAHNEQADHELQLQMEANEASIITNAKCDRSYMLEWKKYVSWVKNEEVLATTEAPFITRTNVDHYFTRVISRRRGKPNGIRRVVNTLNFYAWNKEYVGMSPRWESMSGAVEIALRTQKIFNAAAGGTGRPGSDPHLGLKDILPQSDQVRIMNYIYRMRHDWGPASVNWTWGMNAAIRGASQLLMTFCDLNISYGFGAERSGPLARALLLVLRKGEKHKDRHETDKQVCVWRHINYLLCSVFSTALYVIFSLTQNPDINFHHLDKSEAADWWGTPLIDWEEYSGKYTIRLNRLFFCCTWLTLCYYCRGVEFYERNLQRYRREELQSDAPPYSRFAVCWIQRPPALSNQHSDQSYLGQAALSLPVAGRVGGT
jgi:hypothetical protein